MEFQVFNGHPETFLEEAFEKLKEYALQLAKEPDQMIFRDGVSFCQTFLKTWMKHLRADISRHQTRDGASESESGSRRFTHYCHFLESFRDERRSCWRWHDGSGWRRAPPSSISSPDFGSRYIVASTRTALDGGDKSRDGGVIEFHVCDDRDCATLASSMKSTLERCKRREWSATTKEETASVDVANRDAPTSGLGHLIRTKPSPQETPDNGYDPPPHCFFDDDSETEKETSPTTVRDAASSESDGASSTTSRSGFFSHYAYERTCDMLLSAAPCSQQLLPSVVVDETEQLRSQSAGRVRQLVRMYDGLRPERK